MIFRYRFMVFIGAVTTMVVASMWHLGFMFLMGLFSYVSLITYIMRMKVKSELL